MRSKCCEWCFDVTSKKTKQIRENLSWKFSENFKENNKWLPLPRRIVILTDLNILLDFSHKLNSSLRFKSLKFHSSLDDWAFVDLSKLLLFKFHKYFFYIFFIFLISNSSKNSRNKHKALKSGPRSASYNNLFLNFHLNFIL